MRRFSIVPRGLARPSLRGRHLLLFDVAASVVSFTAALALRFDAPSPQFDAYLHTYAWVIPFLVGLRVASFMWLRLYQRVWRYASVEELLAVLAAVAGSSTLTYLLVFGLLQIVPLALPFPRSIPVIDTLLMLSLAGAWRFALRVVQAGRVGSHSEHGSERTLVVGAGTAAMGVIRELKHGETELSLVPVGVVADDLPKGQRLMGLPVLGRLDELGDITRKQQAGVVLFALPSVEGRTIRRLVRAAEAEGARCLTVPSIAEVVAGKVRIDAIREIQVEDLLRRAPARIDLPAVAASFEAKSILVTGAGGSIGSELVRQLARVEPRRIVLLGRGENSIFEAMQTLPELPRTEVIPAILDVREAGRMDALFRDVRPEIVFHAAAHKHVPLMELYPEEAVATNIIGTRRVIEACLRNAVERFVLISSDKAVNPTSVMGVTKRISELLVQDAARMGARYASVRFGNVLSSRGSVVPLFRKQLERGGPITVTHEEVARYFMTIPEAVQLVLQAAVFAEPGDTFVLDMGDPVRIMDLARDLVELHGLLLGEDVEVRVVGLRPGEKLVEELFFLEEHPIPTAHEAIRRVRYQERSQSLPDSALANLAQLVDLRDRARIATALQKLVPEYVPAVMWPRSDSVPPSAES